MNQKGIGTQVITAVVLGLVIAGLGGYFVVTGGAKTPAGEAGAPGNEAENQVGFEVTSFALSSTEVEAGDSITASVTVKSVENNAGICRVPLTIDGVEVETKEITLAPGETKTVTFTVTKNTQGTFTVGVGSSIENLRVKKSATFEVSNLVVSPAEAGIGEQVNVSITAKNVGELSGTCSIELKIDNVIRETRTITLDNGESQAVSFTVTENQLGAHTVVVNGLNGSFNLLNPATFEVSNLVVSPSETKVGTLVTVSATVKNTGAAAGIYKVVLTIDGQEKQSKENTLNPNENRTIIFTVMENAAGTHVVGVNGLTKNLKLNPLTPATFQVSNLSAEGYFWRKGVPEDLIGIGESVEIWVYVKNVGELSGTYTANFKINGVVENTQTVFLNANAGKSIYFQFWPSQYASYTVSIENLTASFIAWPENMFGAEVEVVYGGSWSGTILTVKNGVTSSQNVTGSGRKTWYLDNPSNYDTMNYDNYIVSVAFQKTDGSDQRLAVVIYWLGTEYDLGYTFDSYGVASAAYAWGWES